jgi:hypothetical protein
MQGTNFEQQLNEDTNPSLGRGEGSELKRKEGEENIF